MCLSVFRQCFDQIMSKGAFGNVQEGIFIQNVDKNVFENVQGSIVDQNSVKICGYGR